MANEKNVDKCLAAVAEIEREILDAKPNWLYRDQCIVNRENMIRQLELLKNNLPDTIQQAYDIVTRVNTILEDATRTRDDTVNDANRQAEETIDNANARAAQIVEQANAQANQWVENAKSMANQHVEAARAQAAQIIAEAQKAADQMVDGQTIMARARAQSEELLTNARNEAASIRQKALGFIDGQLNDMDRHLTEMLNQIRLERSDVQEKFHQS